MCLICYKSRLLFAGSGTRVFSLLGTGARDLAEISIKCKKNLKLLRLLFSTFDPTSQHELKTDLR